MTYQSCIGSDKCKDSDLRCRLDDDCYIQCNSKTSCGDSILDATTSDCVDIDCIGEDACKSTEILGGNGNFTVVCNGKSSCQDTKILGPNSLFTIIDCSGEVRSLSICVSSFDHIRESTYYSERRMRVKVIQRLLVVHVV